MVVGLGNRSSTKRIRFNDIGTGLEVLAMDFADDCGLGNGKQVVIAFEIVGWLANLSPLKSASVSL